MATVWNRKRSFRRVATRRAKIMIKTIRGLRELETLLVESLPPHHRKKI